MNEVEPISAVDNSPALAQLLAVTRAANGIRVAEENPYPSLPVRERASSPAVRRVDAAVGSKVDRDL